MWLNVLLHGSLWLGATILAFAQRNRSAPDSGHMSCDVGFRPLCFRTTSNYGHRLGRCEMAHVTRSGRYGNSLMKS